MFLSYLALSYNLGQTKYSTPIREANLSPAYVTSSNYKRPFSAYASAQQPKDGPSRCPKGGHAGKEVIALRHSLPQITAFPNIDIRVMHEEVLQNLYRKRSSFYGRT